MFGSRNPWVGEYHSIFKIWDKISNGKSIKMKGCLGAMSAFNIALSIGCNRKAMVKRY